MTTPNFIIFFAIVIYANHCLCYAKHYMIPICDFPARFPIDFARQKPVGRLQMAQDIVTIVNAQQLLIAKYLNHNLVTIETLQWS